MACARYSELKNWIGLLYMRIEGILLEAAEHNENIEAQIGIVPNRDQIRKLIMERTVARKTGTRGEVTRV